MSSQVLKAKMQGKEELKHQAGVGQIVRVWGSGHTSQQPFFSSLICDGWLTVKGFFDTFPLTVKLNGGRHVQGILRGFDPFMNLVIDECVEMATSGQQNNIGMVVSKGGCQGFV